MARGRIHQVESQAEALGHTVVWDYVEDTRAHGSCRTCGRKVRITRPYGGSVTVMGGLLDAPCRPVEENGSGR